MLLIFLLRKFQDKCPLYKSIALNELLAHIVSMKYQHVILLYRMASYFDNGC